MKYNQHKILRFILRWFVTDKMRIRLAVTSLMESAVVRPEQTLRLTVQTLGKDVDWTDMTFEHTNREECDDDKQV